jgi:hypothetical protein
VIDSISEVQNNLGRSKYEPVASIHPFKNYTKNIPYDVGINNLDPVLIHSG